MTIESITQLDVFLVEPSHTQQLIIEQLLQDCGVQRVCRFVGGQEVLARLPLLQPDLIVSAMYLPDMTGVELLHAIRQGDDAYDMAFLLVSSETNIAALEPIRQAGAIAILPKPFGRQELQTALNATLDYLEPRSIAMADFDPEDVRILLVDDSEFARKYMSRVLRNIGIERITLAENGQQALELCRQHYFDLLITDYNMPEMDGLQLIDALRGDSEQVSIPVLMVTSEQDGNRLTAVKKAGVAAILDKPFEPASIRRMIGDLLA
ncbi:MAG: response regulator [Methylomonas sp.]|nr:response regulator [Methylomonas sp.]PPD22221.1 MAG: two-component system response regulator [Methylomonas sp.]PPD27786.1 MAG: two-component system response regulator [Methylomonas sp.]PPD39797.1 MAG: two-component system response regulator [Methylomonas sp.]PPD42610.1 MAG: two-component system response regulator [Methylomonas sp.]